jgi:hypothetical protein
MNCIYAESGMVHMWRATKYVQNYIRNIIKQNSDLMNMFLIFLNVGS